MQFHTLCGDEMSCAEQANKSHSLLAIRIRRLRIREGAWQWQGHWGCRPRMQHASDNFRSFSGFCEYVFFLLPLLLLATEIHGTENAFNLATSTIRSNAWQSKCG